MEVPSGVVPTIDALHSLFEQQQKLSLVLRVSTAEERKQKLRRIQAYLLAHLAEANAATYKDFRKAESETMLGEIIVLNNEIKYILKHLGQWMKPLRVSRPLVMTGTSAYIQYEAKGTALILSPWNYPIGLSLRPLVAAIAAGCTVILKPSEHTPHASAFVRTLVEALFLPEEVAVVEGDAQVARELLTLPFNHIYFTGSTEVGKIVMKSAAEHLASVTLELGGKSPCIVDETVDLPRAVRKILWGKFLNNGQTCIAPDYLLVHHSVRDQLVEEFKKGIRAMYDPDGRGVEASESYCRIVNRPHFDRLTGYLQDALSKGAILEAGGHTVTDDRFIEPTLISNVDDSMQILQEEIFGPILPMLVYTELSEVITYINARPKPLALYILSHHKATIDRILNETSSGSAVINDLLIQYGDLELPFGGVNASGTGRANGYFGFQEFSNPKGVVTRRIDTLRVLYPPYTKTIKKILGLILKYA
jgi:aldehyde dehydrogenase (NAD+)